MLSGLLPRASQEPRPRPLSRSRARSPWIVSLGVMSCSVFPACTVVTFTEQNPAVAAPRELLTCRAVSGASCRLRRENAPLQAWPADWARHGALCGPRSARCSMLLRMVRSGSRTSTFAPHEDHVAVEVAYQCALDVREMLALPAAGLGTARRSCHRPEPSAPRVMDTRPVGHQTRQAKWLPMSTYPRNPLTSQAIPIP